MSLFEPAWKTADAGKEKKAMRSAGRVRSRKKLNEIILTAPLWRTRMCAVHRFKALTKDEFGLSSDECARSLMLLDIDRMKMYQGDESVFDWYVVNLFSGVNDQKKLMEIALKSKTMRRGAVDRIRDDACLAIIARGGEYEDRLRVRVAEKLSDKETLKDIIGDGTLPEKVRQAAEKQLGFIEEQERIKARQEEMRRNREKCLRTGHKMMLVRYIPHGQGGKDALYMCEDCGETELVPVEWSTADSV